MVRGSGLRGSFVFGEGAVRIWSETGIRRVEVTMVTRSGNRCSYTYLCGCGAGWQGQARVTRVRHFKRIDQAGADTCTGG